MKSQTEHLFYDGPYDALEKSIALSGKTKKHIAEALWPGRQPETAKSLLSRALSPENTDVHVNLENLLTILRETRPEDFLYYLCDEFGFERPDKKSPEKLKNHIVDGIKSIDQQMKTLIRIAASLEGNK
ncbi:hypothetical protein M0R72_13965 [Candidatus Pacearchaeota archaeon]|jgi:hypothetical protein|nr:hypothetical protein [Candidatus Pacearchaeota archaeon]